MWRKRDRAEDRDLVRGEAADGRDLDEPPEVPGVERQDREDVALVDGQVVEVVERSTGRDERQPQRRR